MTPANEFPGNIIFYALFLGFMGFFVWSAVPPARSGSSKASR